MKKMIFLVAVLFLAACSSDEMIHADYQKDINQMLKITDGAYEQNRALTKEEIDLVDTFMAKYEIGQFMTSADEKYEMNVMEKKIVRDIDYLKTFTVTEPTLESEEDKYTKVRNEVTEYLGAKEIPENLSGMEEVYPTYEIYFGVHPGIASNAKELLIKFDSLVNGEQEEVNQADMDEINAFLVKYDGVDFEEDGKLYYLNDESRMIVFTFVQLKKEILSGSLTEMTAQLFNNSKEKLDI